MVIIDRQVTGAAARAIVNTAMTPTVPGAGGTISVDDDSGYPASGKFEIVLDRGLPNEESILINSRSGTTFTIGQRGYDNTVAQTHDSGVATCELELSARTVQLIFDHVDDVEAAPHSTKLPVGTIAGHDVTARHAYGAAFGTPGTPAALTPDIAGTAGTGARPAREDHVHNVPAAIVSSVGTANTEGTGSSFARNDHVHDIGAGAIDSSSLMAAGVIDSNSLFATGIQPFYVQSGDPGAVGANKLWFDTTNRIIKVRNAGNSAWDSFGFPSVDQVYEEVDYWENVALGGGNAYRSYLKVGDFVYVTGGFVLGGTGAVSGEIRLQLPFTARALPTSEQFACGARCLDAGPSNVYSGTCQVDGSGTTMRNAVLTGASAQWDANTPFTPWAINDRCWFFGGYWRA